MVKLPLGKVSGLKRWEKHPELVFTDSVKASGGVFQKEAPVSQIEFTLSDGTFFSKANILMLEESLASQFLDEYDAFALTSLNDTSLSISTSFLDGPPMSTQAMPFQVGTEYSFDIHFEALNVPNTLTLSVEKENLGLLEIKLVNTETDEVSYISDMGIITLDFDFEGSSLVSTSLREPTSPFEYISIDSTTTTKYKVFVSHHGLSAEDELGIPNTVELQQNYPNPFNPSTNISFGVPNSSKVTLEVFDVLGRKVATLINGENRVAGRHIVNFDAKNLASGMYIYRLQAGSSVLTKKLTLIK